MHFFYLDESGDTGRNLQDPDQPVMVLGGISVRDEGWNQTQEILNRKLRDFFSGNLPDNFELHAGELLSPNGEGIFQGIQAQRRYSLAEDLIEILIDRSHNVHYIAIDKNKLKNEPQLGMRLAYNPRRPYLLAFDYIITYINWVVKKKLGSSARGMIILDKKENFHEDIANIMHDRRYGGPATHRVKWVVEFSYPVDSKKNPMIQLSDLVIYCIRRFIELENGYRPNWNEGAKIFYARCYNNIRSRVLMQKRIDRGGRGMDSLNEFIDNVRVEPRVRWRQYYDLT